MIKKTVGLALAVLLLAGCAHRQMEEAPPEPQPAAEEEPFIAMDTWEATLAAELAAEKEVGKLLDSLRREIGGEAEVSRELSVHSVYYLRQEEVVPGKLAFIYQLEIMVHGEDESIGDSVSLNYILVETGQISLYNGKIAVEGELQAELLGVAPGNVGELVEGMYGEEYTLYQLE